MTLTHSLNGIVPEDASILPIYCCLSLALSFHCPRISRGFTSRFACCSAALDCLPSCSQPVGAVVSIPWRRCAMNDRIFDFRFAICDSRRSFSDVPARGRARSANLIRPPAKGGFGRPGSLAQVGRGPDSSAVSGFVVAFAGRFRRGQARSDHNRRELRCFLEQGCDSVSWEQFRFDDQFHPVGRFVSFLLRRSQLGDKLLLGSTTTRSTIVRTDRHPASNKLTANGATFRIVGQSINKVNNSQREFLRSQFQFVLHHNRILGFRVATCDCGGATGGFGLFVPRPGAGFSPRSLTILRCGIGFLWHDLLKSPCQRRLIRNKPKGFLILDLRVAIGGSRRALLEFPARARVRCAAVIRWRSSLAFVASGVALVRRLRDTVESIGTPNAKRAPEIVVTRPRVRNVRERPSPSLNQKSQI